MARNIVQDAPMVLNFTAHLIWAGLGHPWLTFQMRFETVTILVAGDLHEIWPLPQEGNVVAKGPLWILWPVKFCRMLP